MLNLPSPVLGSTNLRKSGGASKRRWPRSLKTKSSKCFRMQLSATPRRLPRFTRHLANGKHGELDAVAHVRSLIRRIVVKATRAPDPLEIEVEGTLAVLMKNEEGNDPSDIVRCVPPQPLLL